MVYMPLKHAIIIVGGRNDELCKGMTSPFLNDIWVFAFDFQVWVEVKSNNGGAPIDKLGNHGMCLVTEGERVERLVIFGGVREIGKGISGLSNKLFLLELKQN